MGAPYRGAQAAVKGRPERHGVDTPAAPGAEGVGPWGTPAEFDRARRIMLTLGERFPRSAAEVDLTEDEWRAQRLATARRVFFDPPRRRETLSRGAAAGGSPAPPGLPVLPPGTPTCQTRQERAS